MTRTIDRLATSSRIRALVPQFLKNNPGGRLYDLFYHRRSVPGSVAIENTTECNRQCPYCPQFWMPRPRGRMADALFRKIIADLRSLDFSGEILLAPWSEPLLDERLPDLVAYARKLLPRSRIKLQSNGDLLTPARFRRLVRAGVDEIDVSDHYRIEEDRYVPDPPRAALQTRLAADGAGGERIHFHRPNLLRMRGKDRFHNRSGMVPLRNLVHYGQACGPCRFPESYLSVNHRGEVLLCARQWRDEPVFGDLNRRSIREIWRSPEFRAARDDLRRGRFDLQLCRDCAFGDLPAPARVRAARPEAAALREKPGRDQRLEPVWSRLAGERTAGPSREGAT